MVILIVDDEYSVINMISNILNKNFNNCFEIYTASSAMEAYEILEEVRIDILITDICMPDIDGIELAEKVHISFPDIDLIFVSAYDQKEYLKAAIKLNAAAYIEKPVSPEELVEVVKKCTGKSSLKLQNKLTSTVVSKTEFINLLLSKNGISNETKKIFETIYGYEISKCRFGISMIKFADIRDAIEGKSIIETHFAEYLNGNINCIVEKKNEKLYVVVFMINLDFDTPVINQISLCELYNKLSKKFPNGIAASSYTSSADDIHDLYVDVSIALEKNFYKSDGVSYTESNQIFDPEESFDLFKILDEYNGIIRQGVKNDILDFLENQYKSIKERMNMPVSMAKFLFKHFVYNLYMNYSGMDLIKCFDSFDEIENIDFVRIDDLYKFTVSMVVSSYDSLNKDKFIVSVKRIIERSYSNPDFTAKDISDEMCLSASYISSRFKKTMGIALNTYINMVRLNKACVLIKTGDYSSGEISFMVGYNDSNYFSKIFKSYLGMTVTEYKKENGK